MPGKINILPESLSQMIAAGEVIERPASVVKELMENAIDAGASEIVVELKAGGFQLIRVHDDGEGMEREEVPIAIERHATSKIGRLEDLYAIQSLGFRGEALPSIASVSQMVIKTRTARSVTGTQLVCEGGEIKSLSEIGCPVGTEVEVRNIFFNIPVKRKFLKSISLELRHALSQFIRLSLAYPRVTFKFIHDGRLLHEHLRTDVEKVRIEAIFGRENSDQLQAFDDDGEVRLSGWASLPTFSRGSADGIYLYVNGRFVRDRTIYKAILEAYRHVIPQRRFPMVILFLTVPLSAVDVNVHPTKTEVKFREPERLFPAVFSALRSLHQPLPFPKAARPDVGQGRGFLSDPKTLSLPLERITVYPLRDSAAMGEIDDLTVSDGKDATALRQEVRERSFRVLGQALKTYILCEDSEGLIFIDQHAAHERLVFERFKKGYETKSLSVNRLLTPVLMECSSEEVLAISDHLEDLNAMGIEVDPVGKKVFAIRSIPSLIGDEDPRGIIRKIIEEEVSAATRDKTKGALHPILVALSCHSAIRANFEMRKEEMEALVDDLLAQPLSATCPHGRPIFFRLLRDDLEKQFRRHPR